ncbi:hypothetical protein DEO72_LG9g2925 [Vigna unguiculata]|uniref:Uncharacterized protein n=1 Tax=Vigna unguiculata TaxID=3917 RepID=A0A4D6N267_VIGUN|nr:hypothetical protein DEO72_LG9g2925 [Vigna unguiculata]
MTLSPPAVANASSHLGLTASTAGADFPARLPILQQQGQPSFQMLVGLHIDTHFKCPLGGMDLF